MKLTIIGAGTMGTIFKKALLERGIFKKDGITMIDKADKSSSKNFGDIILFAVKPQDFASAAQRLQGAKNKLIISIMAGISTAKIKSLAPGNKVVRSMPNLGAQTLASMTIWKGEKSLSKKEKDLIKKFFSSIGEEIEVGKEELIDAATAVSGSGPGYIYFIARELIKIAKTLGFKEKEAEKMIKQTFWGAINTWNATGLSANTLQNKVTSRKGTTEACIEEFKKNKLGAILKKGIKKAHRRAKQLSKL